MLLNKNNFEGHWISNKSSPKCNIISFRHQMLTLHDAFGKVNKFHLSKFLGPTDCLVKMMRIFWSPRKSKELCIFSMVNIFEKGSPFKESLCMLHDGSWFSQEIHPNLVDFDLDFYIFWISFYLDLLVPFRTSPVFVPTARGHLRCVWDRRMPFAVFHLGIHEISQGAMYKMETSPGYIYIYVMYTYYIYTLHIKPTFLNWWFIEPTLFFSSKSNFFRSGSKFLPGIAILTFAIGYLCIQKVSAYYTQVNTYIS